MTTQLFACAFKRAAKPGEGASLAFIAATNCSISGSIEPPPRT
jgi:hypothetical protein